MIKLYPSLMAANLLNLEQEIKKAEHESDGFHIDIMDHHFVPNLTFGPETVNIIGRSTSKQLWLHLMIEDASLFMDQITIPANSIISFHAEAVPSIPEMIAIIKEKNWLPSIAIKPNTEIETIAPFLSTVDQVLLMSVEPGFAGQKFIESVIEKIKPLSDYRETNNAHFRIAMDGGINEYNFEKLVKSGVQDFAIGSAVFQQKDPEQFLSKLRKLAP